MTPKWPLIYTEWTNMHGQTYVKEDLHRNSKTVLHERKPSEAWFTIWGLQKIKENVQSVPLAFPCRNCRDRLAGRYFLTPRLTGAVYNHFFRTHPSITVSICDPTDWNSFMVFSWWCSTTFSSCSSGIPKQNFSGTRVWMIWANSTSWSSLTLITLGTPQFYSLCYRI